MQQKCMTGTGQTLAAPIIYSEFIQKIKREYGINLESLFSEDEKWFIMLMLFNLKWHYKINNNDLKQYNKILAKYIPELVTTNKIENMENQYDRKTI